MRHLLILALLCPLLSPAQQNPVAPKPLNPSTPQQLISVNYHQSSSIPPHPLTIGDRLPASALNHNPQTTNHNLLIIDFWATWCTSCLHSFSKLDSLQNAFGGKLHVVLVNERGTGDNDKTVIAYFNKHRKNDGSKYAFASLLYDTLLGKYFPHELLPHYVWLDKNLKVLAITAAAELTTQNIQSALSGGPLNLPVKTDNAAYNTSLPLLHTANGVPYTAAIFQSVLTGRLPGFGTFGKKWSDSTSQKITWVNHAIITLYQFAFGFNANRLVIDRALLDSLSATFCSYELIAPASLSKAEINNIFGQDLNRYLGLDGRWQKKEMACLALQRLPAFDSAVLATQGGSPKLRWRGAKDSVSLITNQPLSKIIEALNTSLIGSTKPIVLDETGFTQHVDMVLHAGLRDIQLLKSELAKYGLTLIPAQRKLDVFVLTKTVNTNYQKPPLPGYH